MPTPPKAAGCWAMNGPCTHVVLRHVVLAPAPLPSLHPPPGPIFRQIVQGPLGQALDMAHPRHAFGADLFALLGRGQSTQKACMVCARRKDSSINLLTADSRVKDHQWPVGLWHGLLDGGHVFALLHIGASCRPTKQCDTL